MEFQTGVVAAVAGEPNMLFVAAMGISTVLLGLTCIIFLCSLMSAVCRRLSGKENETTTQAPAASAVPQSAPAAAAVPAPAGSEIPNRSELIAAVTAAIAEELGTDISALRVRSFRRVGTASPVADPARGELVAAISAAVAEELGTDVSAIRIHSLKKIG